MGKKAKSIYVLPKNAVSKINLGQSFAEYDKLLEKEGVYVQTPAIKAAIDPDKSKCFFVGRRGTGKTAISRYVSQKKSDVVTVIPDLSLLAYNFEDTKGQIPQPLAKGLISCFKRAMACEIFRIFLRNAPTNWRLFPKELLKEKNFINDYDFDDSFLAYYTEIFNAHTNGDLQTIGRSTKRSKEVASCLSSIPRETYIIFDKLDEFWDGQDKTVKVLMALMHACIELAAEYPLVRPLVFVRENVFDRIRKIDSEFTRLETCVISLEWTKEFLQEMIERRILLPLNTKPPFGEAWNHFFENSDSFSSRDFIFNFCQNRPRDVLTFCSAAVESAQSQNHDRILIQDIQNARLAFSESRFKELGDEYSENYPQLSIVLNRFHGLGKGFSYKAIEMFIQLLLKDSDIQQARLNWLYENSQPYKFIELLYSIGFVGIQANNSIEFRGIGIKGASPPSISDTSYTEIHPSYVDALHLQDTVLEELPNDYVLKTDGTLFDIPKEFTQQGYIAKLNELTDCLKSLESGHEGSRSYENLIGEVLKYCFYRQFNNIVSHERDCNGTTIKDWYAANVASEGFWEMIRIKYNATQIIWECKNYYPLKSDDFAQIEYYLNDTNRFAVICFRGKEDIFSHNANNHLLKIMHQKKALVLLLNDRDIEVLIRQAINGKKSSDAHLRDRFDATERLM